MPNKNQITVVDIQDGGEDIDDQNSGSNNTQNE